MNFKQEEIIKKLVKEIKEKFPEIEFINVAQSPENPNELWVRVTAPASEEREFKLRDFTSEKSMDILLDYGYQIFVMPTRDPESAKLWSTIELSMEED